MKCIPMTFRGRPVQAAILVTEIDEVLVARIASSPQAASSCSKIRFLTSKFSKTASEILLDRAAGPRQRLLGNVDQHDVVPVLGEDMDDAVAHGSAADHSDLHVLPPRNATNYCG